MCEKLERSNGVRPSLTWTYISLGSSSTCVHLLLDRCLQLLTPSFRVITLILAYSLPLLVRIWPSQANRRGHWTRLASCGPLAEIPEQRSEWTLIRTAGPRASQLSRRTQKSHTDVLGSSGVRDGRTRLISRLRNTSGYAT